MANFNKTVRGLYCLRCSSRKVVRGTLGESARFYPMRGLFKSLLSKPVMLDDEFSHACMDCGLVWNGVDATALRRNLRDYGISPHSTVVMQALDQPAMPTKLTER